MELLADEEIRKESDALRERARNEEPLDDLLPEAFALCREAARRSIGQRHFDVQLIGGMVLHDGAIAEMKTGEGKTLTATLAVFLNTLAGTPVHLVTVNDYLARRDADWMRPDLRRAGSQRRRDPVAGRPRHSPAGLRLRRGLRHQLGVRLRLPARQHGGFAGALRPARARLRDRRRGRQHPDRRGAHAADHLRRPRGRGRSLLHLRPPRQAAGGGAREAEAEVAGRGQGHHRRRLRLRVRREAQDRRPDRAGGRQGGALPGRRQPLRVRARHPGQPPDPVAEGRVAVPPRRRLRGDRRRGEDRRRVHRAHPRGAPLVGGTAPGDRGQGGRADPGGEPDPGDDHAPELLSPLRQARRDDRHGADRGAGVHEDLQDPGGRHPDQRADGPRRPQRPDLQDQGRQVEGRRRGDLRAPRARPADPGRDHLGRGLGDALRRADPQRHRPRRPQRQARARPARGRDDRPGGARRRRDDRHQHGGPRGRHQAGRRSRADGQGGAAEARPLPRRRELRAGAGRASAQDPRAVRGRRGEGDRGGRAVHLRHRAPRVAPDRQSAPRPLRSPGGSRASRASISPRRTS